MLWITIATFFLAVVASTVIVLEYARIDSYAVDYRLKSSSMPWAVPCPSKPCGRTQTVGGEEVEKNCEQL